MWDPWSGKLGEEREKERKNRDTRAISLANNRHKTSSSANWPYLSTQHYSSNIHVPLTLTDGHD